MSLVLENIGKSLGGRPILTDISFTVEPHEVVALLGASGSGKSTLLRLIAGLETVDSGEIRFGGASWSRPGFTRAPELRKIGFVFQDFALFPVMNLARNVGFGLDTNALAQERTIAAWLERVGLAGREKELPHRLSGGEQQRAALARALAPNPALILLDEAFSNLDPALRWRLRNQTLQIIRETGAPTLLVTHDREDALIAADRVAILQSGRLVQIGGPAEIYDRPNSLAAAYALGPVNEVEARLLNGRAETAFGSFPVIQTTGYDRAILAVRPEHLQITASVENASCIVVRSHRQGGNWHATLRPATQSGPYWSLTGPKMAPNDAISVAIKPENVMIFASESPISTR